MKASPQYQPRRLPSRVLGVLLALMLLAPQAVWPAAPARALAISAAPIRFEGYIRAQSPVKWLVGNDLEGNRIVNISADTPIIQKNGSAELGAWVIVRASVRRPGELDALLIEVDRPAGIGGPQVQFIGRLVKNGGQPGWWLVDDTPVEVTLSTQISGAFAADAYVWVGAVMQPSGYRAEWIRALASATAFEFRGTVTQQGSDYRIIDGRRVTVTAETTIIGDAAPPAFVECQALQGTNGALLATIIRVLPAVAEARLTGSIQAMSATADGGAVWDIVVDLDDPTAPPRLAQVKVDGNTWVDQSASVAETGKWVEVRGTVTQPEVYQAGVIRVERGRPRHAAQTLSTGQATAVSAMPWGDPITIIPGQSNAEHPMLAFTADGALHAVWESNSQIYYARQPAGGAWSAPQLIAYGFAPYLVADSDGTLHVAFVNLFLGNYETYHIFRAKGAWSLPVNMAYTTGYSAHPKLALAGDHSLHAVWMDNTPGYWTTYYATWDGQFWSNRPIPSGRGQSPAIGTAPDGSIYVVWQDRVRRDAESLGDFDIFLSTLRDGTWTPPLDISDSRLVDSLGADIASTSDSTAHIVWVDGEWDVRYSYGRGTAWSAPELVSVPLDAGSYAVHPHIVVEAGKYLHLAWQEEDGYGQAYTLRVTAREEHAAGWPAGYAISSRNAVRDAMLAAAPTGGVGMSWAEASAAGSNLRISLRQPMREDRIWLPAIFAAEMAR